MQGIVRRVAIAFVLVGLVSIVPSHPSQPKNPTMASSKAIPIPVCPPNDPNACHIDQW
jgi:hypothetical protein